MLAIDLAEQRKLKRLKLGDCGWVYQWEAMLFILKNPKENKSLEVLSAMEGGGVYSWKQEEFIESV